MSRAARVFVLISAALLLAACASLVKLAYSNAALAYTNLGSMVTWMVDDYVDLHTMQEGWVEERVTRMMEWHRTQELPKYRRFIESAAARVETPFTAADVAAHYREMRVHYHRLVEQVLPDVAEFLGGLDAQQVAQLQAKFTADNRKFVRESVKGTPAERSRRRMKRLVGHLESWVGPLHRRQRELVAAYYEGAPDFTEEILAERRVRQSEIIALARARPPREAMLATLRRLFIDTESWRRPEYLARQRARDQKMFALFADLGATLDERQREALRRRVRGLLRDITELTAANRGAGTLTPSS